MRRSERSVLSFEIVVKPSKQAASPPPLANILARIKAEYDDGNARIDVNRNTATAQIEDLIIDEEQSIATILVKYIDKLGSDVSFTDYETGESRKAIKGAREGRDFGAHLCLSIRDDPQRPGVYPALVERVTGVSSTIIGRLLNAVLRALYDREPNAFRCDEINGARHRDGRPKQINFRPLLVFQGLPSDQFIADLEEGEIKDIQLIEQKNEAQFGAHPWLVESQRIVKLEPTRGRPAIGELWGALTGIFREAAETDGFGKARVRFTRADGQADTIDVDAETGTLLDQRYIKSTLLTDIDPPLGECPDGIVDHFVERLVQIMIENRGETD